MATNDERAGEQEARPAGPEPESSASAPAAPRGGLTPEEMEQLKSLAQLHDQGILTDEEFDQLKAKVLGT